MKIVTVCGAGLVRSVALADVLKLHFEPTDVLCVGMDKNSEATQHMLFDWADKIVLMTQDFMGRIPIEHKSKTFVCEVGADTYKTPKNQELIDKVFQWARKNYEALGIKEHNKVI